METTTSKGYGSLHNVPNAAASDSERSKETPHIRACTNCVRAKARCSPTIGVDAERKCERCFRMKKLCQPSPPVRRQRTLKRPLAIETSKLEEKLDGLVTLIKSATQGAPGVINANSLKGVLEPASHEGAPRSIPSSRIDHGEHQSSNHSPGGSGLHEANYTPITSYSSTSTPLSGLSSQPVFHLALEPSAEDAELYLVRFRTRFIKHLPFISIAQSITAHQLRMDRPFLWIVIMTVSSDNSTQQKSLSREMREIIGRHAFVEATRNMDFLLAVLVYVTWDRCYCFEKPVLIGLIQLSMTILYDLQLDKTPSKDPALSIAYEMKGILKPPVSSRTMEERRVLLGCFLMSSITSATLKKGSTMRWNAYSNECLRILEAEQELESDAVLAQLVKLRLLSGRVTELPWLSHFAETDTLPRVPAMFYLKSLEAQLYDFKCKIPNNLSNDKSILLALHSTELSIYEIGLSQAPDVFNGENNRRTECLWVCLNTSKSLMNVFFEFMPAEYVGFSQLEYSILLQCLLVMYRLLTFEHPEWDRALAREHVDLSAILERSENNLANVKEVAGLDAGGSEDVDSFTFMASRIRVVRLSWESTKASMIAPDGTSSTDPLFDFPLDFSEEDWLKVLGSWNG